MAFYEGCRNGWGFWKDDGRVHSHVRLRGPCRGSGGEGENQVCPQGVVCVAVCRAYIAVALPRLGASGSLLLLRLRSWALSTLICEWPPTPDFPRRPLCLFHPTAPGFGGRRARGPGRIGPSTAACGGFVSCTGQRHHAARRTLPLNGAGGPAEAPRTTWWWPGRRNSSAADSGAHWRISTSINQRGRTRCSTAPLGKEGAFVPSIGATVPSLPPLCVRERVNGVPRALEPAARLPATAKHEKTWPPHNPRSPTGSEACRSAAVSHLL